MKYGFDGTKAALNVLLKDLKFLLSVQFGHSVLIGIGRISLMRDTGELQGDYFCHHSFDAR